jgi:hypothetical protein
MKLQPLYKPAKQRLKLGNARIEDGIALRAVSLAHSHMMRQIVHPRFLTWVVCWSGGVEGLMARWLVHCCLGKRVAGERRYVGECQWGEYGEEEFPLRVQRTWW